MAGGCSFPWFHSLELLSFLFLRYKTANPVRINMVPILKVQSHNHFWKIQFSSVFKVKRIRPGVLLLQKRPYWVQSGLFPTVIINHEQFPFYQKETALLYIFHLVSITSLSQQFRYGQIDCPGTASWRPWSHFCELSLHAQREYQHDSIKYVLIFTLKQQELRQLAIYGLWDTG